MATISGQNLIQAEKTYVVVIKRSEIEPCYSLSSPQFAYGVQPHKQIEGMKGIMSGSWIPPRRAFRLPFRVAVSVVAPILDTGASPRLSGRRRRAAWFCFHHDFDKRSLPTRTKDASLSAAAAAPTVPRQFSLATLLRILKPNNLRQFADWLRRQEDHPACSAAKFTWEITASSIEHGKRSTKPSSPIY